MKTIQVSDDLYARLLAIAQQIQTQDNRATATPYMFQIQTPHKVWDTGLNGDQKVVIDMANDYEELGPFNRATLVEYCKEHNVPHPDWLDDVDSCMIASFEFEDWMKDNNLIVTSFSIEYKLQNGFLTEAACVAHIEGNGHHYDSPKTYLSHLNRNPDMTTVFDLMRAVTASQQEAEIKWHAECISCPNCGSHEKAAVLETVPWHSLVHECTNCQYVIMESEWKRLTPEETVCPHCGVNNLDHAYNCPAYKSI